MRIVEKRCYPNRLSRALYATYDVIRKYLYSIACTSWFCIVVDNISRLLEIKNFQNLSMLSESLQRLIHNALRTDNILKRCYPSYPESTKRLAVCGLRTDNFSLIEASNWENVTSIL